MGFKENLRDELAFQGLLIKELAARTGLNQSSLSNYLRGNSFIPSADIAVKIAQALDVSVEYLVTGRETPPRCPAYSAEVRQIAKRLSALSKRDIGIVAAVVERMEASADDGPGGPM